MSCNGSRCETEKSLAIDQLPVEMIPPCVYSELVSTDSGTTENPNYGKSYEEENDDEGEGSEEAGRQEEDREARCCGEGRLGCQEERAEEGRCEEAGREEEGREEEVGGSIRLPSRDRIGYLDW